MDKQIVFKSKSRRRMPLHKRDMYCMTALDRLKIKYHRKNIEALCPCIVIARRFKTIQRKLILLGLHELFCILELSIAEIPVHIRDFFGGLPAPCELRENGNAIAEFKN